jgi:hypothetical protein
VHIILLEVQARAKYGFSLDAFPGQTLGGECTFLHIFSFVRGRVVRLGLGSAGTACGETICRADTTWSDDVKGCEECSSPELIVDI